MYTVYTQCYTGTEITITHPAKSQLKCKGITLSTEHYLHGRNDHKSKYVVGQIQNTPCTCSILKGNNR